MHVLAGLGLLSPNDVHDAVVGELAVVATHKHVDGDGLGLSEPELVARGALYAQAQSTAIAARSQGARSLATALNDLYAPIRDEHGARDLDEKGWLEAMKDDPDAAKTLAAWLDRAKQPTLPPAALAPCFRAGAGEYVAYDAGFDLDATRADKDGRVVGVRADGPAAKAGLKDGDVIEKMQGREGDAEVPVKLSVTREGKRVEVTYAPRGAHGRGQTWTRVKGVTDDRCGL
jgi:predicted metalloprotease with PDZ domain